MKMDGQFIHCALFQAHELQIIEPKKKRNPQIKDLIRVIGRQIFDLDKNAFLKSIEKFNEDKNVSSLLGIMSRINENANYDANKLLNYLRSTEPCWMGRELVTVPCLPFIKLPHRDIKFVWNAERTKDFLYPGFSKLKRNLVSARIQSTSMDLCKIAMFTFRDEARERWPALDERPKIVNCIHDEIAVECRENDKEKVMELLIECMTNKANFQRYVAEGRFLNVDIDANLEGGGSAYRAKAK